VILGYAFTFEALRQGSEDCVLHPLGLAIVQPPAGQPEPPFFRASGTICSLPALAQASDASGFLNAAPDSDGILRRVPLVIEYGGQVYPGLALAAVAMARGSREIVLRVANVNTVSLSLDDRIVPLDGKSDLLLRFRGRGRTFPYTSAVDVLNGQGLGDSLKGKLVFVGASALGTREVLATPLDTLFPGVEVQATVADNLLTQDFVWRPEHAVALEAQTVLALGIGLALLVARAGLGWGTLAVLGCLGVLWRGAEWLLTTNGGFLSPLYPTIGLTSALVAMAAAKVTTEQGRAERAGREKTTSQQLMIQTLLSLAEVRDEETGSHSRRTERYTRLLAEQLSEHPRFRDYLTPERVDLLATLAPLHDIGKVGIPDRLLNKPDALTHEEMAEMRKHPAHGREVIVRAERDAGTREDEILAMAKEIVYTHHERWDGTGYPRGLSGERIPIAGRVIAVVDAYDAIISKRVYREPLSHDEAVDLIALGSGKQFDPAVVEVFLRMAPVFKMVSRERLL
jgi:adenylate cyclase